MEKKVDEKVIQVKEAIKKFGEETVEKIVTRKKENRIFYTNKKFEEWLQENYKAFTKKELKILKFEIPEATTEQQETTERTEVESSETTNDLQGATDKKKTTRQETIEEKEKTTAKQQETTERIEVESSETTNDLQGATDKKKTTKQETIEEKEKTTAKQQETTGRIEVESSETTNDLHETTDKKEIIKQETIEEKEKTTTKQQETTEKIEPEIIEATNDLQETINKTSLVISERLQNEELGKKFLYFLDNIDEFISIGRKAENDLLIPNEILLMSSFSTSLRISREVLDKFNKFCNEHKNYSKIQILNFALLEFVNKYTKE